MLQCTYMYMKSWLIWVYQFKLTDIDDCENVVCLNEGTCVDRLGSYVCICKKGFSGQHCESGKAHIVNRSSQSVLKIYWLHDSQKKENRIAVKTISYLVLWKQFFSFIKLFIRKFGIQIPDNFYKANCQQIWLKYKWYFRI